VKRFHLFAGHDYDGAEGIGDYGESYDTLEEAMAAWPFQLGQYPSGALIFADWGHIVESIERGLLLRLVRYDKYFGDTEWRVPDEAKT
jgi:hypothetical protein